MREGKKGSGKVVDKWKTIRCLTFIILNSLSSASRLQKKSTLFDQPTDDAAAMNGLQKRNKVQKELPIVETKLVQLVLDWEVRRMMLTTNDHDVDGDGDDDRCLLIALLKLSLNQF